MAKRKYSKHECETDRAGNVLRKEKRTFPPDRNVLIIIIYHHVAESSISGGYCGGGGKPQHLYIISIINQRGEKVGTSRNHWRSHIVFYYKIKEYSTKLNIPQGTAV